MPDIFGYGDYRRFINDWYLERKVADRLFSLRKLAELSGFKTKTFLFKVMRGEKAISLKSVGAVAVALELNKGEAEYFDALVHFNEGTTVEEREKYFERLRSFKYTHQQVRFRSDQFSYFSKWYHAVIRELVTIVDFRDDFRILAKAVFPHIRPQQAESAVKLLVKLGLIEQLPSGRYHQTEANLTTGDELVSTAVQRFQKDTLELAGQAIDRFPQQFRDISTLTMGLSEQGFQQIKQDLQLYRKHLIDIAAQDAPAERVYQLNMQFFPVSTQDSKKSRKGAQK